MSSQSTGAQADGDVQGLLHEVEERFGVLPNFFRLAPESPEITANLWAFARSAYLDNPLPSLFKERLFVYLSRFCEMRYCIVRHIGFLVGLGRPSGDRNAPAQTVDHILSLLRRPIPLGDQTEPYIARCAALLKPLAELPPPDSELEEALFTCAAHAFLQTADGLRSVTALRHALGGRRFDQTMLFLAFVQTAHYWTRIHPELEIEDDVAQLLASHEALAACLVDDPDAQACTVGQKLINDLEALREGRRRQDELARALAIAHESEARLRTTNETLVNVAAERVGTEAALRLARSRLESTLAAGEVGTWDYDVANDRVHADPNLAGMFGIPTHEAASAPLETFTRAIHHDDLTRVADAIARAIESGDHYEAEFRTAGADGETRWVTARGRVERDAEGKAVRLPGVVVDLTGQRHAEFGLRATQRRWQLALEAADLGAWNIDPSTDTLQADKRFRLIVHGTSDPLTYEESFDAIHPDDRQRIRDAVAAATRPDNPAPYAEEYRVVHPDGSVFWVLAKGRATFEESAAGRHLVSFDGTLGDITERKQAAQALRESEERFRSLVSIITDVPWNADPTGAFVAHQPAWAAYTGQAWPKHKGFGWADALHPDDRDDLFKRWAHARQNRSLYEARGRLWHAHTAQYRHFIVRATPLLDDDGTVREWVGSCTDTEDQHRADQAIRDREANFRALAANIPQLAWMAHPDGHVFWYNERWYQFTGTTPDSQEGWGWKSVHHPDHLEAVTERWSASLRTGQPWEDTFPLRNAAGHYRWFLSRAVPIHDETGEISRWFGTNTDVTEQLAAEQTLRDADRRKDEFLATLAHELRNPLAPIRTGLEVMKLAKDDPATLEEIRTTMERQTHQLIALVDDLLDVSRINRGKLELRKCKVNLADVVQSALEAAQPSILERHHHLSVAHAEPPVYLEADPHRLAQVLSNLLNNAAHYTPDGGDISLSAQPQGSDVVVSVKDTGIGIPPDMLDRIFEMFTQVERPMEKAYSGLGIGLSLVRSIVEMHGGTIEAHSEGEDHGSEFKLRLPRLADRTEHPPPDEPPHASSAGARHPKRKVLVVDDNKDAADMLSAVVRMAGNEVRTAYDGAEGVETAADFRPDVILMDLGMPRMNGYEAARLIRAQTWGQNIVLVALTGWGYDEDRKRTNDAGFDHHLVKPADPAHVESLLSSRSTREPTTQP